MATKGPPAKRGRESSSARCMDALPEVAIAAIASYRRQKEVSDFINFILDALERNLNWLNNIVNKQHNFRCALMSGAGPNRFQIHEIIYPSEKQDIKLEVELNESEDYDKIALAALLKISNIDLENMLKYLKTRMYDNPLLKEDMLRGKAMGISFAVLSPYSVRHYRVMERIVIGSTIKCLEPAKKRRRENRSLAETFLRKSYRH